MRSESEIRGHGKRILESDLQRALLLRMPERFPHVRAFRRNVGLVRMSDDRMFRASIPGQCDLYVLGRGGWHGEVEIKRWGKLSERQATWRAWCLSWAVPWLLLEAHRAESPQETVDRWVDELFFWLPAPVAIVVSDRPGRPDGSDASQGP